MKTNSTQESLKKYFYTGIGHISHASDVLQQSAKELSRQGKVTEADGRKIVNDAMEEIEHKYNEAVQKLVKFTRSEVSTLQNSIGKMERRVLINTKKAGAPAHLVKSAAKRRGHIAGKKVHLSS